MIWEWLRGGYWVVYAGWTLPPLPPFNNIRPPLFLFVIIMIAGVYGDFATFATFYSIMGYILSLQHENKKI